MVKGRGLNLGNNQQSRPGYLEKSRQDAEYVMNGTAFDHRRIAAEKKVEKLMDGLAKKGILK